jgi:hypothetical protein
MRMISHGVQVESSDEDVAALYKVAQKCGSKYVDAFWDNQIVREALLKANRMAEREGKASFLPILTRLFQNKRFDDEISELIKARRGSFGYDEIRDDVEKTVAGKLLLEQGHLREAAEVAHKIRTYYRWRENICKSVAARMAATRSVEQLVHEATASVLEILRDKMFFEAVKKLTSE